MVDAETGTILFSKDPDKLIPPASLAKLMTMEVVFNALKAGRYTLDDTFQVSENAWRTGGAASGGSTMFAELKSTIRLEDLIQGVVVQSANDGCIIIAEGMAGSEENFATLMTERAREIGLTNRSSRIPPACPPRDRSSPFASWCSSASISGANILNSTNIYSQPDFTWNKITQRNRNPLLAMDIGADGMKTGFTEESGYAIVGSVSRGGKRVFAAMSGMTSERERAEEARKMLDWGMRAFQKTELFADDEVVGEAQVYRWRKSGVRAEGQGADQHLCADHQQRPADRAHRL